MKTNTRMAVKRWLGRAAWTSVAVYIVVSLLVALGARGAEPALAFASPQHPILNRLAQRHASYMARVQVQGHQGFSVRAAAARNATGLSDVAEICAESWKWQHAADWNQQWAEYEKCWRQSPGHWNVARRRHRLIGVGSARGRNNVWYGVLLAADP